MSCTLNLISKFLFHSITHFTLSFIHAFVLTNVSKVYANYIPELGFFPEIPGANRGACKTWTFTVFRRKCIGLNEHIFSEYNLDFTQLQQLAQPFVC